MIERRDLIKLLNLLEYLKRTAFPVAAEAARTEEKSSEPAARVPVRVPVDVNPAEAQEAPVPLVPPVSPEEEEEESVSPEEEEEQEEEKGESARLPAGTGRVPPVVLPGGVSGRSMWSFLSSRVASQQPPFVIPSENCADVIGRLNPNDRLYSVTSDAEPLFKRLGNGEEYKILHGVLTSDLPSQICITFTSDILERLGKQNSVLVTLGDGISSHDVQRILPIHDRFVTFNKEPMSQFNKLYKVTYVGDSCYLYSLIKPRK